MTRTFTVAALVVAALLTLGALFVGAGVARELWQMAFDTLQAVKP